MGRDGQVQKKSFSATPPQPESLFERRPRHDPAQDASVQLQADESPEWQARRERYIRNSPDFSKMPMEAPETVARQVAPLHDTAVQSARPALSLPSFARERADVPIEKSLQRQTAPEEDESALQRQTVEEEPEADLQAKSLAPTVQRQESEKELEEIQPKLTIGQPGDRYEQEADAMAAKVMTMPEPGLQREELTEEEAVQPKLTVQQEEMSDDEDTAQAKFVQREELTEDENPLQAKFLQREELPEEETPVQRKSIAAVQAKADSSGLEGQLQGSKGGGSPLAEDTRSFMELRFNTDFSHVRVHTDSSAVQMNKDLSAQAFTHGSDVYFGAGKSPGQNDLTAHELTHVVQQTGSIQSKQERDPQEKQSTAKSNLLTDESVLANPAIPSAVPLQPQSETPQPQLEKSIEDGHSSLPKPSEAIGSAAIRESAEATSPNTPHHVRESVDELGGVNSQAIGEPHSNIHEQPALPKDAEHLAPPDGVNHEPQRDSAEAEVPVAEELPQPDLPESPALANVAQQIIKTTEAEKAILSQTAQVQRTTVMQQAEAKAQAITITTQGKIAAITAALENNKAQVKQTFSSTKATVKGQTESQKAVAQADGAKALSTLRKEVESKRKSATDAAEDHAKKIEQAGQTESERAGASATESSSRVKATADEKANSYGGKPPEVRSAVRQAVGKTASDVTGKMRQRSQELAKNAKDASQKSAKGFRDAGKQLASGIGSNTGQVEKAIQQGAGATASSISTLSTQQLQKLDALQTQALASLEKLKGTSIPGVRQAGQAASQAARKAGQTAVKQIDRTEKVSLEKFAQASHGIVNRLQQIPKGKKLNNKEVQKFTQGTEDKLRQTRSELGTAISDQANGAQTSLNQLESAFSKNLEGAQQKVATEANKATTSLNSGLVQVPGQVMQQSQQVITGGRDTNQNAIQQFSDGVQQKIDAAKQSFGQEQQKTHNDIRSKVNEGVKPNKDVENQAPNQLAAIAKEAENQTKDSTLVSIGKGILKGIGKILSGLVSILEVAIPLFLLALALPLVALTLAGFMAVVEVVALAFLIVGFVEAWQSRAQQLKNIDPDMPGWKVFLQATKLALFDLVGITDIYEGLSDTDIVTGKKLNLTLEQRTEKTVTGVLTLIPIVLLIRGALKDAKGEPIEDNPIIVDPYALLGKKYNLRAEIVEILRSSKVDPIVLDRLFARGVDHDIVALVADIHGSSGIKVLDTLTALGVSDKKAARAIDDAESLKVLNAMAELADNGVLARLLKVGFDADDIALLLDRVGKPGVTTALDTAEALAQRGRPVPEPRNVAVAAAEFEVSKEVNTLARAPNFTNPDILPKFLKQIPGSPELRFALEKSVEQVSNGDEVILEGGQADVLNLTRNEAVQYKDVQGKNIALFDNLRDVSSQLRGEKGELPPNNSTRVAELRINNPQNAFFNADRAAIRKMLIDTNGNNDALRGVDTFKVTNNQGTHIFRVTNRIVSENTLEQ